MKMDNDFKIFSITNIFIIFLSLLFFFSCFYFIGSLPFYLD